MRNMFSCTLEASMEYWRWIELHYIKLPFVSSSGVVALHESLLRYTKYFFNNVSCRYEFAICTGGMHIHYSLHEATLMF
jgi:hypothetical protein